MTYAYTEQCKEIISAIDPEVLASMTPGTEIGRGNHYAFRTLGKLVLAETTELYVGVKTPKRNTHRYAEIRLAQDLAFVNFVTHHSPELSPFVPRFMGVIFVEGDDNVSAVLTEDASRGGEKQIASTCVSNELRAAIYKPFQELGTFKEIIREDECDSSLGFSVNREGERLLDFSPLPISSIATEAPAYVKARVDVWDVVPDLTITIPANSPLADGLR